MYSSEAEVSITISMVKLSVWSVPICIKPIKWYLSAKFFVSHHPTSLLIVTKLLNVIRTVFIDVAWSVDCLGSV